MIKWTKEDIEKIKEMYPKNKRVEIEKEFPKVCWESIRGYAKNRLKLKRQVQNKDWSKEETEILKEYYPTSPKEEILNKLEGRTWKSIITKNRQLGIYRKFSANIKIKDFSFLTESQRGYIAGLIDGEGSITKMKFKNGNGYEITITNTNLECLEWVKRVCNSGGIYLDKREGNRNGYRACWKFRMFRGGEVMGLLIVLKPYLIIKRNKSEEIMKEYFILIDKCRKFIGRKKEQQ